MNAKERKAVIAAVAPFLDKRHAEPGRLSAECIAHNLARALHPANEDAQAAFLVACGLSR